VKKTICIGVIAILLIAVGAWATPKKVVVGPFKLGVATSMPKSFWDQFRSDLKMIVDIVMNNPAKGVKLKAQSDGNEFDEASDAKNGGLAWDRLFGLKQYLFSLGLTEDRIVEERCTHVPEKGGEYRFASVEIVEIKTEKDTLYIAPAGTLYVADTTKNFFSKLRLGIGAGLSSAEEVDWITRFNASIDYNKIVYVIFNYDHSVFTRDKLLPSLRGLGFEKKATWNREYELLVAVFPTHRFPVGLMVGGGQYENLVKDEDTYHWRRRSIPFGLLLRGGPVMCRLSTDYGFSDYENEQIVKWGIGVLTASITLNIYFGGAK